MALRILLILSIVSVVSVKAGWKFVEEEDDIPTPEGYRRMYTPPLMQPPHLPGFPAPLPLMAPPPLFVPILGYQGHHRRQAHVHSPVLPFFDFDLPSPGEMKDIKPGKGQVFSGVSVKSSHGFERDEEGNVIKTGGSTVVTNDNGDVNEFKVGKNPPNMDDPPLPVFGGHY